MFSSAPVGEQMAIYRLLQKATWDQADIDRMTAAYEAALKALRLADRTDPLTEMICQKDHRGNPERREGLDPHLCASH